MKYAGRILAYMYSGPCTVAHLSHVFKASDRTIRRSLAILEGRNLVGRDRTQNEAFEYYTYESLTTARANHPELNIPFSSQELVDSYSAVTAKAIRYTSFYFFKVVYGDVDPNSATSDIDPWQPSRDVAYKNLPIGTLQNKILEKMAYGNNELTYFNYTEPYQRIGNINYRSRQVKTAVDALVKKGLVQFKEQAIKRTPIVNIPPKYATRMQPSLVELATIMRSVHHLTNAHPSLTREIERRLSRTGSFLEANFV